jgi:SAM-dependent methyltransferase
MTCLESGERQVAPEIAGIRHDHVARYTWAAELLRGKSVIDVACGVGYGSWILAEDGQCNVLGIDRASEAVEYARQHYEHGKVHYRCGEASALQDIAEEVFPQAKIDAAACFETIEHIEDPLPLLKALREKSQLLVASVPNEDFMPFGPGFTFHYRHYTARQFEALLNAAGWHVESWWGQLDESSEVERDRVGRTLIAVARPGVEVGTVTRGPRIPYTEPERVAILGLGPSVSQYLDYVKRQGGRKAVYDEVWAINALGDVVVADKIFHMDDVRIQEIRAAARPSSSIAHMVK